MYLGPQLNGESLQLPAVPAEPSGVLTALIPRQGKVGEGGSPGVRFSLNCREASRRVRQKFSRTPRVLDIEYLES